MIEKYLEYAAKMGANSEVMSWIDTTLKADIRKKFLRLKAENQGEIEHILDYLCSSAAPKRLQKMSYAQAKLSTDKWMKANQKKGRNITDEDGDIETIHEYADGSKIVKLLTERSYKREGFLMSHCLGGYSPKSERDIYSYRDAKNQPHATFEVQKNQGQITQIKGKGNGPICPRYILPILDFLKSIGQEPRESEMKNLGYYFIDETHLPFLKTIDGWEKQVSVIYGKMYAHN
jgi:hypothetical protein